MQAIYNAGDAAGDALNVAGKNLSDIFSWKDNTGKYQIKGDDFTGTIDPNTGKLTIRTGIETTRTNLGQAGNLEKILQGVENNHPGLTDKVTSVSLQNSNTSALNEFNRISKELENQLKEKLGNSSNLDNLTPVQQTDQAKYYSPSQLPSLTTNGREHLDYLRGDMRTKLDAANAEGKLPSAQNFNSIDDLARSTANTGREPIPDIRYHKLQINELYENDGKTKVKYTHETYNINGQLTWRGNGDAYKDEFDANSRNVQASNIAAQKALKEFIANHTGKEGIAPNAVNPAGIPTTLTALGVADVPAGSGGGWGGWLGNLLREIFRDFVSSINEGAFNNPNQPIYLPSGVNRTVNTSTSIQLSIPGYNPNGSPISGSISAPFSQSNSITDWNGNVHKGKVGYPLIIDLNRDGLIKTTSLLNGNVHFDMDGDGSLNKTGWASTSDGFLCIDDGGGVASRAGNGKVDGISEMFGGVNAGFADLATHDSNNDGWISNLDADWSKLRIWKDANGNGLTDTGELKPLEDWQIKRISLSRVVTVADLKTVTDYKSWLGNFYFPTNPQIDETTVALPKTVQSNGNLLTQLSQLIYDNGDLGLIGDVGFRYSATETFQLTNRTYRLDTITLPWIRGMGDIRELTAELQGDTTLFNLTRQLANESSSIKVFAAMDEFMARWANVETEPTTAVATLDGFSYQKARVLERFLNTELLTAPQPDLYDRLMYENAYERLKSKVFLSFIAQTSIGRELNLSYDYTLDEVNWSATDKEETFARAYLDPDHYSTDPAKRGAALVMRDVFASLDEAPYTTLRLGGAGNELLQGSADADLFDSINGNDTMLGGLGNDVYVWRKTSGTDFIRDEGGSDTVAIDGSMSSAGLRLKTTGTGEVRLLLNDTPEQFLLINTCSSLADIDASVNRRIERIFFQDTGGDSSLLTDVYVTNDLFSSANNALYGTSYNDYYDGLAGDDQMWTSAGDDILIGGKGNDVLDGGAGDDRYYFNLGDGQDILAERGQGGNDSVLFGAGITKQDIALFSNGNHLFIKYSNADQIIVADCFQAPGLTTVRANNMIEALKLADGSVLTLAEMTTALNQMSVYATQQGLTIGSVDQVRGNNQVMDILAANW